MLCPQSDFELGSARWWELDWGRKPTDKVRLFCNCHEKNLHLFWFTSLSDVRLRGLPPLRLRFGMRVQLPTRFEEMGSARREHLSATSAIGRSDFLNCNFSYCLVYNKEEGNDPLDAATRGMETLT